MGQFFTEKRRKTGEKHHKMLYANYHTHTKRCRHAEGTEREYIETAIKNGIKILGFADHSPMIFSGKEYENFRDGNYYSGHRMYPEETENYFKTILDLKQEYKDDIEIRVGLELEYYPWFFEKTIDFIEQFPCEYLILGQHFSGNEIDFPDDYAMREDGGTLRVNNYLGCVLEAMDTGKFLYLAHPDVLNFTGSDEVRRDMYERICTAAKKHNMPLEINMLGIRTNRKYPRDDFWQIAAEHKNRVVLGVDAHCPQALADENSYEKALELAARHGIEIEKKLDF